MVLFKLLKISILFLSSIGFLACSKPTSSPLYTLRILKPIQESRVNSKAQFINKTIEQSLELSDFIVLEAKGFPVSPNELPKSQVQIQLKSQCQSESTLSSLHSSLFQTQGLQVYDLLPPQVLNSYLNNQEVEWTCNLWLHFKTPENQIYKISFLNKQIQNSNIPRHDFLYESPNTPYSSGSILHSQFQKVFFSSSLPAQSLDLICENFSSHISIHTNESLTLDSLALAPHTRSYTPSSLDPRVQMHQQNCHLRLSTETKTFISQVLQLTFAPPAPEVSCIHHRSSFNAKPTGSIATLSAKNNFNFPITLVRNIKNNVVSATEKWEANSREIERPMSRGISLPLTLSTNYGYQKTIGDFQYIWLHPGETVTWTAGSSYTQKRGNSYHLILLKNINEICKIWPANGMFDSFEKLIEHLE